MILRHVTRTVDSWSCWYRFWAGFSIKLKKLNYFSKITFMNSGKIVTNAESRF